MIYILILANCSSDDDGCAEPAVAGVKCEQECTKMNIKQLKQRTIKMNLVLLLSQQRV